MLKKSKTPVNAGKHLFSSLRQWLKSPSPPRSKKGRTIAAVAVLVIILGGLLAVPHTRYGLLGRIIKRPITVEVIDSRTNKPVSEALISIQGQNLKTNSIGQVNLSRIAVGKRPIGVNKKYYDLLTTDIFVPLLGRTTIYRLRVTAIGNQVTVKVINKITGKPLAKAHIGALGTTATTGTNGEAVIVLPVQKPSQSGTIKLAGYNDLAVTIKNTETLITANTFSITPAGKLYFLSKRTGKIDVMKSDIDGSNPAVILAGTGNESDTETALMKTGDSKFLALKASRDSVLPKLYVIDTATDKVDVFDEGKVEFGPIGWSEHLFVFKVDRTDILYWQPKKTALKSYDADKKTLTTLEETQALGGDSVLYSAQRFENTFLIGNELVYTTDWSGFDYYGFYPGRNESIFSISLSTGVRATLKDFAHTFNRSISARPYKVDEMLFSVTDSNTDPYNVTTTTQDFYKFSGGKLTTAAITADAYNQPTPWYLRSPSGKKTYWSLYRDGKNTFFTGDGKAGSEKTAATLAGFSPYGWYTDDYVLLSKNDSELYIAPADFSSDPLKVTNYHRPHFNGYGEFGGGF